MKPFGYGPAGLRDDLAKIARKRQAAGFGIASVDDADALERVKIGWVVNRYTTKIRPSFPEAKSVVLYACKSLDDADELAVNRGRGRWTYPGYDPLVLMVRDAISLLRRNGFKASLLPDYVNLKRIAVLAGIGAFGKNSLIISPRHGPWLRFHALATDAELPLDKPFTRDLCGRCTRCVRACPVGALKPYVVDSERCLVGANLREPVPAELKRYLPKYEPQITPRTHVMCTVCQLACPYTPPERRRNVVLVGRRSACRRASGR